MLIIDFNEKALYVLTNFLQASLRRENMNMTRLNVGRNPAMNGSKNLLIVIFVLSCIATASNFGYFVAYNQIQLQRSIVGHLKRAADANTVELASSELAVALSAIEKQGLTEGYTSVLYTLPSEDIGFWYKNLKAAQGELAKVNEQSSQMERTNILIKLRETLMDHSGKSGDNVTYPQGLARFPNNRIIALLGFILVIFTIIVSGFLIKNVKTGPKLIETLIVIFTLAILGLLAAAS